MLARNRVGIVVVTHQQEYLEECLASVLNQSVAPWSIVLVDNASPSDARASDIAEQMGVHAVRLGLARSLATARNVGCEVLDECGYILCLDGDDLLEHRFVEVYLNAALRQKADVVYGPAELFGTMSGVVFAPAADGRQPDLRRGNYIAATSLFSRDIWRTAGGFDPELAFYEDWDFWLSCAENGARIVSVDDALWRYRRHGTSMLATAVEEDKSRSRRYIRAKHLPYIWGPFQWRRAARNIQKLRGRG